MHKKTNADSYSYLPTGCSRVAEFGAAICAKRLHVEELKNKYHGLKGLDSEGKLTLQGFSKVDLKFGKQLLQVNYKSDSKSISLCGQMIGSNSPKHPDSSRTKLARPETLLEPYTYSTIHQSCNPTPEFI
jgi:hypothetical protein